MSYDYANIVVKFKIYSAGDYVSDFSCRPNSVKPDVAQDQSKAQKVVEQCLEENNLISSKIFRNGLGDHTVTSYSISEFNLDKIDAPKYFYKGHIEIQEGNLEAKQEEINGCRKNEGELEKLKQSYNAKEDDSVSDDCPCIIQ